MVEVAALVEEVALIVHQTLMALAGVLKLAAAAHEYVELLVVAPG